MEYFDENIAKDFHENFDPSIPSGFEWNEMKSGIKNKMKPANSKRRKYFIFFFLLAGLMVGGLSVDKFILDKHPTSASDLLIAHNQSELSNAIESSLELETDVSYLEESARLLLSHTTIAHHSHNQETNLELGLEKVQRQPSKSNNVSKETSFENTSTTTAGIIESSVFQSSNIDQNRLQATNTLFDHFGHSNTSPTIDSKNDKIKDYQELFKSGDKQFKKNTGLSQNNLNHTLPSIKQSAKELRSLAILALKDLSSPQSIITLTTSNIPQNKKSTTISSYTFSSGALLWRGRYSGGAEHLARRNSKSSSLPGFHAHLAKNIQINDKIGFSIGLGYQELFELFDATIRTTVTDTFVSALTRSETSLITGLVTQTREDLIVTKDVDRRIRHYNAFKSAGIELAAWRNWKIGKRRALRTTFGLNSFLTTYSSGKTIGQNNTVIEYNDSNMITRAANLSVAGGVFYDHKIKNRLSAQTGVRAFKYISNLSKEKDVIFKPLVCEFTVGLTYKM